jgi:hypothetical protein
VVQVEAKDISVFSACVFSVVLWVESHCSLKKKSGIGSPLSHSYFLDYLLLGIKPIVTTPTEANRGQTSPGEVKKQKQQL